MLLQFPILIAFYGLLNKHFELRGAMFIPGWIPDLSVPETVATLPFNLPFLGNEIHLLPIFYTVSMIFSMKITQSSSGSAAGSQGMMKMMTYGMPIMFFFVLYNAPSGLILYWSVMNIISVVQQIYTNKKRQKEDAEEKVIQFQSKTKGKKR
jgi:YidC/Oxa1 family membrane protein insertase